MLCGGVGLNYCAKKALTLPPSHLSPKITTRAVAQQVNFNLVTAVRVDRASLFLPRVFCPRLCFLPSSCLLLLTLACFIFLIFDSIQPQSKNAFKCLWTTPHIAPHLLFGIVASLGRRQQWTSITSCPLPALLQAGCPFTHHVLLDSKKL